MAIIRSLHLIWGMLKEPRQQCPRTTKIYEASFLIGQTRGGYLFARLSTLRRWFVALRRPSSPRIDEFN
jgi:hypothetical protein